MRWVWAIVKWAALAAALLFVVLVVALFALGSRKYTLEPDVVYGEVDGQKLLVDIYHPGDSATRTRPALVLVHGGAWAAGSRHDFKDMAVELAKEGYVVFSIEYRLVTEKTNRWPAQLDDSQRAVRWVRAHAAQYHLDPQHLGVIGGSAGGHLVACLGTMDTHDNSDPELAAYSSRAQVVVDMNGPTNLEDSFAREILSLIHI